MQAEYPTRQVAARRIQASPVPADLRAAHELFSDRRAELASGLEPDADALAPLVGMVLGLDQEPRPLTVGEVGDFGDPFTQQILLKGHVPLTLADLAAAIDGLTGAQARPVRKLYVVAEGAAFQPAHPRMTLNARLVFTWQRDTATAPDFLLSTVASLHDPQALLQLIAWSEPQGAFHFFERTRGVWAWAGNSHHALREGSRGLGPFDSHVNGGLVMKELKAPWLHWHSQANGIPRELVFAAPEVRSHPLFASVEGAEVLERAVRAGVRRWTRRRLAGDLQSGRVRNLPWYARQLLWTTSVNLASSELLASRLDKVEELELPRSFFFDDDGMAEAAAQLGGDMDVLPQQQIVIPAAAYRQAIGDLQVQVQGGTEADPPVASVAGDTQFAFAVPERAFEDQAVLAELLRAEVLSPRLALCLLMVDFPNPVFSPARAALLAHFPPEAAAGQRGATVDQHVLASVQAAAAQSAPARELIVLWMDADLPATVQRRLADYIAAVQRRLRTPDGARDLLLLAEARRHAFRQRRLNEFRHTIARNGALVSRLAMREDATLAAKDTDFGEREI